MFETETPNVILNRMLKRVSPNIDKRQGSVIYDTLMPLACELHYLYTACDYIIKQSMPSTQDRDNLILFADTFNLRPNEATYAEVEAELVTNPSSYVVPNGTRFSGSDVNYVVISHKEKSTYYLRCETPGSIGNKYFGTIRPIFNISQLISAKIVDVSLPGNEEESTERFRERVRNNFKQKAFGGNYQDYYDKVIGLQGVGGCKIVGTPERNKTLVDIYILDTEYKVPAEETIAFVQNEIHPWLPDETQETIESSGLGLAPIGHDVTVKPVREKVVNIVTNLAFKDEYNWGRCESDIESAIKSLLLERTKEWEELDHITVRVSAVENSILSVEGVIDIWDTTLNEDERSAELEFDEIPVMGTITGTFGGETISE